MSAAPREVLMWLIFSTLCAAWAGELTLDAGTAIAPAPLAVDEATIRWRFPTDVSGVPSGPATFSAALGRPSDAASVALVDALLAQADGQSLGAQQVLVFTGDDGMTMTFTFAQPFYSGLRRVDPGSPRAADVLALASAELTVQVSP